MLRIDHQGEALGEQRPFVEALPGVLERPRDRKLGGALFEQLDHLGRRAAQDLHLQARKQPPELGELQRQEIEADRTRKREPQRPHLATLDGGGEGASRDGAVVALPEQRQHAVAKLGQLGLRPLASEQVAAQLALELLDCAGQRGLRHVAFVGCLGEIQLPDGGQEISNLMHLHSGNLSTL
jgi:hypothetical protein